MIPKIDIFNAEGSGLQDLVSFGSRPLGGTTNPVTVQVWNDKGTAVSNENIGEGDGNEAVFPFAHGNLIPGSPCVVKVAGTTKTETTHYNLDRMGGKVTFTPGNIPTSGQAVTVSYYYGTGAGTAENIYVLARRRQTFLASGDSVTLAELPSTVYEVSVNSIVTTDYTVDGKVVTLDSSPTPGDMVLVIYEDESCSQQMLQIRSNGIEDPFSVGIVDDEQSAFIGVGGSIVVADAHVGDGDDATTVFTLPSPCIVEGTLVVKVDSSETEVSLDPVTGEIEFGTAPGDGDEVTASYRAYRVRQIGAIPPGCARHIQLRGHAPTAATQTRGEAHLEVWAV